MKNFVEIKIVKIVETDQKARSFHFSPNLSFVTQYETAKLDNIRKSALWFVVNKKDWKV